MRTVLNQTKISRAIGVLILVSGLSGCSMFSTANAPVDCDLVKTQVAAGKSDAQVASDIGAPVAQVAACHGPETSGNKSSGMIPSTY
jgi:cytochrome c553